MAFGANTAWEVRTTGSDANNGGGFNPSNVNMLTDGAATSATTASPVFTSASYSFVAGDVGAWVYVKSGTNWRPGWYQIASVAGGAATLNAAIGAYARVTNTSVPTVVSVSTAAGCATTASPSGATWSIDYSQRDAARLAYTDLVIGATNTTATSAANPFGRQMTGNIFNVTGGTGFTVQRVEVVTVASNVATFDKALGTASSTGGAGYLGGALTTIAAATAGAVTGNAVFVRSGTYTSSSNISPGTTSGSWNGFSGANRICGYAAVRGDNPTGASRPTIQAQAGVTTVLVPSTNVWNFEYLIVDCNGIATNGIGNGGSQSGWRVRYCKVANFKGAGISVGNTTVVEFCEVTGGISGATWAINLLGGHVSDCYVHDNVCGGIAFSGASGDIVGNLVANNTGGSSDGIVTPGGTVMYNTVHGSGRDGIRQNAGSYNQFAARSNVITGNGAYGLNGVFSGLELDPSWNGNVYYNNATANRSDLQLDSRDVLLTGSPYVNAAGGNFGLNATAGAGAAARGSGTTVVGSSTVDYSDAGVAQHQDTGGSGGGKPGFSNARIKRVRRSA